MKSLSLIVLKSTFFFSLLFFCYCVIFFKLPEIKPFKQIILPSLVLSLFLTIIHIVLAKKSGVTNNFSANQKLEVKQELDLNNLISKIEKSQSWTLIEKNDNVLLFKSTFGSIKSFGEIITISSNEGLTTITSKSLLFTTLFDFGKNYENIKFIKSIM